MIAKKKSNDSLDKTIDYNVKDESRLIGSVNLIGKGLNDFRIQMKDTQACFKGRAKKLTMHAIISPTIDDGKKLSIKDWKEIAHDYLKGMGMSDHQCLIFLHTEREHRHLHLVANLINDKTHKIWRSKENDLRLSHRVGQQIAKARGLKNVKDLILEKSLGSKKETNSEPIGSKAKIARDLSEITFKDRDSYFNEIQKRGFKLKKYFNKNTNEVRGYGVEKYGTFLDASKIGKQFTLRELEKNIENKEMVNEMLRKLEKDIGPEYMKFTNKENKDQILQNVLDAKLKFFVDDIRFIKFLDTSSYFRDLEKSGFRITAHLDKGNGSISGYSLSKYESTFNASALGPKFRLSSLIQSIQSGAAKKPQSLREIIAIQLNAINFINSKSYFKQLRQSGFEVQEIKDSNSSRVIDYKITRYGHQFQSGEISKRFELKSLETSYRKNLKENLTAIRKELVQRISEELPNTNFSDLHTYISNLKDHRFEIKIVQEQSSNTIGEIALVRQGIIVTTSDLGNGTPLSFRNFNKEIKRQFKTQSRKSPKGKSAEIKKLPTAGILPFSDSLKNEVYEIVEIVEKGSYQRLDLALVSGGGLHLASKLDFAFQIQSDQSQLGNAHMSSQTGLDHALAEIARALSEFEFTDSASYLTQLTVAGFESKLIHSKGEVGLVDYEVKKYGLTIRASDLGLKFDGQTKLTEETKMGEEPKRRISNSNLIENQNVYLSTLPVKGSEEKSKTLQTGKILQTIKAEFRQITFTSIDSFFVNVKNKGFDVTKNFDKNQSLSNYSVKKYGVTIKSSDLGPEFSVEALQNGIRKNRKENKGRNRIS